MSAQANAHAGLTSAEAAARLARFGQNALPQPRAMPLWRRIAGQFKSALIYLLLFALALDLALWLRAGAHEVPIESIAIAAILVLNAALGAYQEAKAEEALARLKSLAMPFVWTRRDGALAKVPVADLVPGDVVRLEAGDRVPADGVVREGQGLTVDESIVTGESLPVDKAVGSAMFSGALVASSAGHIELTETGPASTMGRLATLIGSIEDSSTPLERRLTAFGNQVALGILAVGLVLTVGGVIVEGVGHLGQVVLFAVALAVAAVPEGLPAVMTLTMALGVERLAARKAVVRRLSAVEALGSVTVIATDKTGTLTENRMSVRALDTGDEPRALLAMVLANDAEAGHGAGDPLELALLAHAEAAGLLPADVHAAHTRVASFPFDSITKFMAVTVSDVAGRHYHFIKGAPEVLLACSTLTAAERASWEAKALARASEGYRVLALAWRDGANGSDVDTDVTFLGLVMLWDPPRPEVPDAIALAKAAGVRVIMITGDHPATARAVGAAIGIDTPRVVTGAELESLSAVDVAAAVGTCNIFARVAPEQKLQLVEALQAAGEIVAVTGDGVNDAPALKRADVGVAMGLRGSDVAREVSDVVLLDDNFATIVAAIEAGRGIYENIQKGVRFFFSTDLALILVMVAGLGLAYVLGLRDPTGGTFLLPLTAVQLLWINVIADGPPALALAFDRNPGLMARPPRAPSSRLLDDASLRFIVVSGALKAVVGIGLLAMLPRAGVSVEETRTALFLFESLMQLVFAYPVRRINATPLANGWLHWAVGLGVVLQFATVLAPPLRNLLGLVPLTPSLMALVVALAAGTWAVAEVAGRWFGLHQAGAVRGAA